MASLRTILGRNLSGPSRPRSLQRQIHQSPRIQRPNGSPVTPPSSNSRLPTSNGGAPRLNGSASTLTTSGPSPGKKPSAHLVWYREVVPAMLPIIFLSSTIFLTLTLVRTHLSHSLSLEESNAKIQSLELQLARLRREQRIHREREKRERERILPLVVGRVLQKVGVKAENVEVDEEDGEVERLVV